MVVSFTPFAGAFGWLFGAVGFWMVGYWRVRFLVEVISISPQSNSNTTAKYIISKQYCNPTNYH
jgi:hypothetical protein